MFVQGGPLTPLTLGWGASMPVKGSPPKRAQERVVCCRTLARLRIRRDRSEQSATVFAHGTARAVPVVIPEGHSRDGSIAPAARVGPVMRRQTRHLDLPPRFQSVM